MFLTRATVQSHRLYFQTATYQKKLPLGHNVASTCNGNSAVGYAFHNHKVVASRDVRTLVGDVRKREWTRKIGYVCHWVLRTVPPPPHLAIFFFA